MFLTIARSAPMNRAAIGMDGSAEGTNRRGSRTTSSALPDASHKEWNGSKPLAPERVIVYDPPDEAELAAGLIYPEQLILVRSGVIPEMQ